MIQIYPHIDQKLICPICKQETNPTKTVWQGIHVGVESECNKCQKKFYQDLRVGHSLHTQYSVDLTNFELFGPETSKEWYGIPLLKSLENPKSQNIEFKKEIYKTCDKVVLLNCIDYLYGHSLLKLLNAERHLKNNPGYGLVLIIPEFLEWMVPEGIAEKWVFNIPLKDGKKFFTNFNDIIHEEMKRFSEIYISKAYSHPKYFDITNFTGIETHSFQRDDFRVTFIWREDRLWMNHSILEKVANKFNLNLFKSLLLTYQKRKIIQTFRKLRKAYPDVRYTVTGFGKHNNFPKWIDNKVVHSFNSDIEKNLCKIYSESRVIVGIHGSNMLLPSAHAGMTVDLMPMDRWGNFAQDVLYQEKDVRMSSYRYRYIPISVKPDFLPKIIIHMISDQKSYIENMVRV
ncbi:MAG: hypothetical protein RBT65_04010 [Methanolobus sp.]|nr:hypothetical protein [Methanolobus sp.]